MNFQGLPFYAPLFVLQYVVEPGRSGDNVMATKNVCVCQNYSTMISMSERPVKARI